MISISRLSYKEWDKTNIRWIYIPIVKCSWRRKIKAVFTILTLQLHSDTSIIYSSALLVHPFTYFRMDFEKEILLCLIWIYFTLQWNSHYFINMNITIVWLFHIILATNLFTNSAELMLSSFSHSFPYYNIDSWWIEMKSSNQYDQQ